MGRRVFGLGVIIAVVLAALVAPAVAGRKIEGTAAALPIPLAPQAGDCLLDGSPDSLPGTSVDTAPRTALCSVPHLGEIITQTATVKGVTTQKKGGGSVPDLTACANTAYWYLGVHPPDAGGERSAVLGPWWPAFSAEFEALLPSPLQSKIGQSWSACVMSSPHGPITGSMAHLFGGPPRVNPVALCAPSPEITFDVAVSCSQPHSTEILGWRAAMENTDTQKLLDQSCSELTQRITGMPDTTAQGALRSAVVIIPDADERVVHGWGPGRGGSPFLAACTITTVAESLLSGTLTGLGDAPVPWA